MAAPAQPPTPETNRDATEQARELHELAADLRRVALRVEHAAARLVDDPDAVTDQGLIQAALVELGRRGERSKLLKLDRPLLRELCHRLIEPGDSTHQTIAWLRDQTDLFIGNNAVYRLRRKLLRTIEQLSNPPQSAHADPRRRELIALALAQVRPRRNQLLTLPEPLLIEALERGLASPFNGYPGRAWLRTQTALTINNRSWFTLWEQFRRRYQELERQAAQPAHDEADQAET